MDFTDLISRYFHSILECYVTVLVSELNGKFYRNKRTLRLGAKLLNFI